MLGSAITLMLFKQSLLSELPGSKAAVWSPLVLADAHLLSEDTVMLEQMFKFTSPSGRGGTSQSPEPVARISGAVLAANAELYLHCTHWDSGSGYLASASEQNRHRSLTHRVYSQVEMLRSGGVGSPLLPLVISIAGGGRFRVSSRLPTTKSHWNVHLRCRFFSDDSPLGQGGMCVVPL